MRNLFAVFMFVLIVFIAIGRTMADVDDGLVAYYPFYGNANDESGNLNHGTVYDATLTSDRFGNADNAYYFDGNDIILVDKNLKNFNLLEPSTELTISAWIRNTNSEGRWYDKNVISKDVRIGSFADDTPAPGYLLRTDYPDNEILFYAGGFKPTAPHVPTVEWLHVVGTYLAGVKEELYINGVKYSERTSDVPSSIPYAGGDLGIGGPFDLSHGFFKGMVDDIRIYNRVLSETEIQKLFRMRILTVDKDSYLRKSRSRKNINYGAERRLVLIKSKRRIVVSFDISGISTLPARATLIMTLARKAKKWGRDGGLVSVHRLYEPFTEGNGKKANGENYGTCTGVTWNCPNDADISNRRRDGNLKWRGGCRYMSLIATDSALHTNDLVAGDTVQWDVTNDIIAALGEGETEVRWVIKKELKRCGGRSLYYSKEGAARRGITELAPKLILE